LLRNLNHGSYLTYQAAEKILDKARRGPPKPATVETAKKHAEILGCEIERFVDRLDLSIARKYLRGKPKAVAVVDKLLAKLHTHIEAVTAEELTGKLPEIAQIDRLIESVERRRNAMLRELDRRRALLAETLRRTVQEVEDAEYQVVETPLSGKH
jgi:hypothetical protein